jgi:hypothetical protein
MTRSWAAADSASWPGLRKELEMPAVPRADYPVSYQPDFLTERVKARGTALLLIR